MALQDPNDITIDPWAPLDYKGAFGDTSGRTYNGGPLKNAPWLSSRDRRRLSAYLVLHGYANNVARKFLPAENRRRHEVREYGDPSLIIEQALSAVLGEQQQIVVEGADDDTEETESGEQGATAAQIALAADWQERLRDWAINEQMQLKVLSCERNTVSLGDGVYVVFWDGEKGRPRLQSWDPGFYFPVLPDDDRTEDYPTKVHFVWEIPPEETDDNVSRLVRLTYELKRIEPIFEEEPFGEVFLREGDRLDEDGFIVRDYPWSDEPSQYACYMTQREWRTSDVGTVGRTPGVDALDISKSTITVRSDGVPLDDLDLGIDFVPVVHVPNVYLGQEHFGQSILTKAAQVVDDLQATDTDAARASSTTGSPILAASGVSMPASNTAPRRPGGPSTGTRPVTPDTYLQIRPGMILTLGENGRLSTVDTSANLNALAQRVDNLRGRMTQNVRIPDVALGIIGEGSNEMSGIALEIRYAPMQSLIRSMRSVRDVKYSLLLKFVQRFLMASEDWDGPTETVDATYQFGGFMPKNLEGTLTAVGEAYSKGIISLETAVQMLIAAGIPAEEAMEEVRLINKRSFEKAVRLMDATGDREAVYDFLGLELPTIQLGAPVPPTNLPATGARPAPGAPAPTPGTPAPPAG